MFKEVYKDSLETKKHSLKKIAAIAMVALSSSLIASCSSSGQTEAVKNNNPKLTTGLQPEAVKNPQTNNVGTPITNLCAVAVINAFGDTLLSSDGNGAISCKDSSSIATPNSLGIADWSQDGQSELLLYITPNYHQPQSTLYGPAENNVWAHDVAHKSSTHMQLEPDLINGQPALWLDLAFNVGSLPVTEKGMEFKYGNYLIASGEGGQAIPGDNLPQFEQLIKLTIANGFKP